MAVVENAPHEQEPNGQEGTEPGEGRKVILAEAVDALGIMAHLEKPIDPFVVVREVMKRVGIAQAGER